MPQIRSRSPRSAADALDLPRPSRAERLISALLVLAVLVTFAPLFTCNFTTWDDNQTVVQNPWLNPPALSHFPEFWNPAPPVYMDIYMPLTYTVWSGVAAMSYVPVADPETGAFLNPWVFHGANVLLHAGSALLAFAILKRLTRHPWAAAAGAALFALHPVQVEPVGWVSGMKDVLAGFLSLLAIWQYVSFAMPAAQTDDDSLITSPVISASALGSRTRWFHYGAALFAFACAMLAKPSAVVLPLIVGMIDLALLRRSWRAWPRVLAALVPWLALAIPIIVEGRLAQPPTPLGYVPPIGLRPLIATDALAYYLYKLALPIWLCIVYDHSPRAALAQGRPYFTWIAPLAVAVAALLWRKRFPWFLAAVGVYWLAVLPVLGLAPFDFQRLSTVADHYLYLAMLGPAMAAAFVVMRTRARPAVVISVVVLAAMAARSLAQTWTWRDSRTLYRHALAVNPHGWTPRESLAILEDGAGHPAEALRLLEQGDAADVPTAPGDRAAHHETLGDIMVHLHRYRDALREYEAADAIVPGNSVIRRKIATLRRVVHS
jgi:hypothetical protein